MGRTRRKRSKKRDQDSFCCSLEHETNLIDLKTYMTQNNWKNDSKLQLRNFIETGRGVTSTRNNIHENDILITIPYNLMITYNTLKSTNFFDMLSPKIKLTITDLLSLFLVLEKHKNEKSRWKYYINSLPIEAPTLPWLLSNEEINLFPTELQIYAKKTRNNFQESWSRLKKSIDTDWTCDCCNKNVDCVLDMNIFTWSYVLVNTRAVYVDPQVICNLNDYSRSILSDEPCMALCPYLDMFNHSFMARTKAELNCVGGQLVYQLTTFTPYKKFNQIFISYGSHDNIKLLMEYGFFLRGNCYDVVKFCCKEILDILGLYLNKTQDKFISSHNLIDADLYIDSAGVSFNLKALLFVVLNPEVPDFSDVIYRDSYPELFLQQITKVTRKLLKYKLAVAGNDFDLFQGKIVEKSEYSSLVLSYLCYRKEFIDLLINKL